MVLDIDQFREQDKKYSLEWLVNTDPVFKWTYTSIQDLRNVKQVKCYEM